MKLINTICFILFVFLNISIITIAEAQTVQRAKLVENDERVTDCWSWLHWWEANKHNYIILESRNQNIEDVDLKTNTSKAVEALIQASKSRHKDTAIQAILSLGKIGDSEATHHLLKLSQSSDRLAAATAIIALGINGNYATTKEEKLSPANTVAWLHTLAMQSELQPDTYANVFEYLNQTEYPPAQHAAALVYRVHAQSEMAALMRRVLRESLDPMLVNEAILTLGKIQDRESEEIICKGYFDFDKTHEIASLAKWYSQYDQQSGKFIDNIPAIIGLKNASAMALANFPAEEKVVGTKVRVQKSEALEILRKPYKPTVSRELRKSIGNYPLVDQAWWSAYHVERNTGNAERRFGILAIGQIGTMEDAKILMNILNMRYKPSYPTREEQRFAPNREFAAIAIGLFIRRSDYREAENSERIQKTLLQMVNELSDFISEAKEPQDFRAACIMALAISRHQSAASLIKQAIAEMKDKNAFVLSHAALALAMLGDQDAIKLARNMIDVSDDEDINASLLSNHKIKISLKVATRDIIGARVLCQAIGVAGNRDDDKLLHHFIGHETYTSQQAITSLCQIGSYDLLPTFIDTLNSENATPRMKALAAWAIGEYLNSSRSASLLRIVDGANFTLPNFTSKTFIQRANDNPMYFYRALAQPFLYKRLMYSDQMIGWH